MDNSKSLEYQNYSQVIAPSTLLDHLEQTPTSETEKDLYFNQENDNVTNTHNLSESATPPSSESEDKAHSLPYAYYGRSRKQFTTSQTEKLEETFQQTKYLSFEERTKLAESSNLTERQVEVWFQNRRTKLKKEMKNKVMQSQSLCFNNSPSLSLNNNVQSTIENGETRVIDPRLFCPPRSSNFYDLSKPLESDDFTNSYHYYNVYYKSLYNYNANLYNYHFFRSNLMLPRFYQK